MYYNSSQMYYTIKHFPNYIDVFHSVNLSSMLITHPTLCLKQFIDKLFH